MLLLTPLTPYLWAQRTAPGQLEIGGLNSGTTMHQVQSKKKKEKTILSSWTTVHSVEYHLNQSHDTSM